MRKIAQEVTKAVAEQGRASRDIMKAAQSTTKLAVQVRKATAEQAKSAAEIAQAIESMRRGAVDDHARAGASRRRRPTRSSRPPTAWRAWSATVVEGDGRAERRVHRDRDRAPSSMRQQADQAAKALKEQSRAMKDMTDGRGQHRQARSRSSRRPTASTRRRAGDVLQDLAELRRVTDRNAAGVRQTRASTADLLRYAEALTAVVDDLRSKRALIRRGRRNPEGGDARADRHPDRRCGARRPHLGRLARREHRASRPRGARPAAGGASCPTSPRAGCCARFEQVLATGEVQVLAPAFHHYLVPCPPRRALAATSIACSSA